MASTHYSKGNRILLQFTIAGLIIGALFGVTTFVLEFVSPTWQAVTPPPENAAEILAYHDNVFEENTLYVRTSFGNIYTFGPSAYGADDVKWRKADQVNREASGDECNFSRFPTPNPPGRVVDQLESHPCDLDSSTQVNHIILEDGSIWWWGKSVPDFEEIWALFGLIAFVIIGGGLGMVAGMLIGFAIIIFKKL